MPPLASKMRSFGARNGLPPMPSVTVVTVPSRRRLLIRLPSPSAASRSGVGDGEVGRAPLRDHLWQGPPVTRNAEIDPGDNDPPPKFNSILESAAARVGIATLIFCYFLRYFSSTHRTDLSRFRGTFHRFDPVGWHRFGRGPIRCRRKSGPPVRAAEVDPCSARSKLGLRTVLRATT